MAGGSGAKRKRGGFREGSGRKPEFDERVLCSVSLERTEVDALQAIADRDGVSLSAAIRRAVQRDLGRHRGKRR